MGSEIIGLLYSLISNLEDFFRIRKSRTARSATLSRSSVSVTADRGPDGTLTVLGTVQGHALGGVQDRQLRRAVVLLVPRYESVEVSGNRRVVLARIFKVREG